MKYFKADRLPNKYLESENIYPGQELKEML
jgi:hypothetical protein